MALPPHSFNVVRIRPEARGGAAGTRVAAEFPTANAYLPPRRTLPALRKAAAGCQGCGLYERATQTVFGEGPADAKLVVVGEQPGDAEDRSGRPFVGPAGGVLSRALVRAGIDKDLAYVTNTVKHFSFEQRGKARIHKQPKPGEVRACWPWLEAELKAVEPRVVVLLGRTAAQAVFGPKFSVVRERGKVMTAAFAPVVIATVHPSSILRAPDSESRHRAFDDFARDLAVAARELRAA